MRYAAPQVRRPRKRRLPPLSQHAPVLQYMYIIPTMGPTESPAVAVGRAVWTSASISSNAPPGHEKGENAHIAGGPSVSKGVENPPVRATYSQANIL